MVFPPPPPDAERGAAAWLAGLDHRLELHGSGPFRFRVLASGTAGTREAVAWLGDDCFVAPDLATLDLAPPGAPVLYFFRPEDSHRLNGARDVLKERGWRMLVWVQAEQLWLQRSEAPDFDHWFSGEVVGPKVPVECLRQLSGREKASWEDGDLDRALDALGLGPRVSLPVEDTAFSVLADAAVEAGVKLWRDVHTRLAALLVELAMAGVSGPAVLVRPHVRVPGWWPVRATALDPVHAHAILTQAGEPRGSAVAARLDYDAGAIALWAKLPSNGRPDLHGPDPAAAVVRAAVAVKVPPPLEAEALWARVTGQLPAGDEPTELRRVRGLAERTRAGIDDEAIAEAEAIGLLEVAKVWRMQRKECASSPAPPPPQWDVFLAYADGDAATAEAVYAELEGREVAVGRPLRVFMDKRRLLLGDAWDEALPAAQRAASVTVVLISAYTDRAWYTQEEIAAAIQLARAAAHRVIPVRLDVTDPPYGLRRVHGLQEADPARIGASLRETLTRLWQEGRLPELAPLRRHRSPAPADSGPPPGTLGGEGTPLPPYPFPLERAFIGREPELRELDTVAAGDPARIVVIEGMPGVGKSWLVDEWLRRNPRTVRTVVLAPGDSTAETLLGRIAGQRMPSGQEPLAVRLNAALADSLVRFENMDDQGQVEAVAAVARLLPDVPMVVTARYTGTEALGRWHKLPIPVLPRPDAIELLRSRAPGITAPDADNMAAAVGDLPLAVDLAAGWLRRGRPVAAWLEKLRARTHTLEPASANLPGQPWRAERTLCAALELADQALVDDGGPAGWEALSELPLAACPTSLVAAALGVDEDKGWFAARTVADHGLLGAVDGSWQLHGVVRDWLQERLGEGRPAVRARVDAWFVAQMSEAPKETRGARWAAMAAAPELVAGWLGERVVDVDPLFTYARSNGPFLAWKEVYAGESGVWSQLRAAELARSGGEYEEALRLLERTTPTGNPAATAFGAGIRADILRRRGKLDEALHIRMDEQLPIYTDLGDVHGRATAFEQIADIHLARGQYEDALRIFEDEVLPVVTRLGDRRSRAVILGKIADIHRTRGRLDDALRILTDEELPVYTRLGDTRSRAVTLGRIADIHFIRGQFDEALRILSEEVIPVFTGLGDPRERAVALGKVADIHRARSHLDEALQILSEDVLPTFTRLGDAQSRAVTLSKIADIQVEYERYEGAHHTLTAEVLPLATALGDVRSQAVALGQLAEIDMIQGRFDEAFRMRSERELPIYTRLGDRRAILICRAHIADILARRGHPTDRPRIQLLLAQALSAARAMRLPEAATIESWQQQLGLPVGETAPE